MKDILSKMIKSYFMIVFGIVFSTGLFCLFLDRGAKFGIEIFWQILLLALFMDFPIIVFLSKNELNKKQFAIRSVLHCVVLAATLFLCAHWWGWVNTGNFLHYAILLILYFAVYAGIMITLMLYDRSIADKFNKAIKLRKEVENENTSELYNSNTDSAIDEHNIEDV